MILQTSREGAKLKYILHLRKTVQQTNKQTINQHQTYPRRMMPVVAAVAIVAIVAVVAVVAVVAAIIAVIMPVRSMTMTAVAMTTMVVAVCTVVVTMPATACRASAGLRRIV